MFTMRFEGGAPVHEQLARRITELILSGEMAEGEKLPTVREVARMLSINPNTVQKTYVGLEARGLIYSIPAKGSYVSLRQDYIDKVRAKATEEFTAAVESALRMALSKDDLIDIINKI